MRGGVIPDRTSKLVIIVVLLIEIALLGYLYILSQKEPIYSITLIPAGLALWFTIYRILANDGEIYW